MPSILLVVFVLQLAIHLVNTIGASTINSLLWVLYTRLLPSSSKASEEQTELKSQFMKVRKELNATSSQDEFAKWAKLRRQHDKLVEQLEKNKSSTDSTKTTFDSTVSTIRWIGTNGLRLFIQFWYSKQAMFWIPKGWVPYYAEWLLSFPRAPLGSVSVQAWGLACGAIVLLVSDAIVAIVSLAVGAGSQKAKEPMKVPSEKAAQGGTKKEL
ncbi:probable Protein get1 [Phialocephala subalpina]|uniref:Probable Protein get1 n=1 Tax=Phialocephala subalpina TaxID=576137 RepID=A0A1L7X3N7_9HELO|nr:probable Protein get1 [Phialocephala subalpina]